MPEIFREKIDRHSFIAIWKISETLEDLQKMLPLRSDEKELYSAFMVERRKKQWLAYRILVRSLLDPEEYPVRYDDSGKPFLAGSRYHISVTHSGDMAAVIISSAGLVGIDIELVRSGILKITDKYLHESELVKPGSRDDFSLLTLAWCAKEALFKLHGKRGLSFKANIRLLIPEGRPFSEFRGEIRQKGSHRTFKLHWKQLGDYILVYTVESATHSKHLA